MSSEAFLAPQPTQEAGGGIGVDVLTSELAILREVYRDENGNTKLDNELLNGPSPSLTFIGKLDDNRILVFDGQTQGKVFLTLNLRDGTVKKVFTKEQFRLVLRRQIDKPVIVPVIQLQNGWLLCYEVTSKSIFAMRADPQSDGILANNVLDPDPTAPPPPEDEEPICHTDFTLTVQSFYEFQPNHVLVIPKSPASSLPYLRLKVLGQGANARLLGCVIEGFIDFNDIKVKTGNDVVDIKDFPAIGIPGTNKLLLFDRAEGSSSFIEAAYQLEDITQGTQTDRVYRTTVEVGADGNALSEAIQEANQGGDLFTGLFLITTSFAHPDALLPAGDANHQPLILAFDTTTNNLLAYDFSKARRDDGKVAVFSSSTDLAGRTDLRADPIFDSATLEPQLSFAMDDARRNRLAFDASPGDVISLNYDTGQWVVVLHRRDIGLVTGVLVANLAYLETLEDGEVVTQVRALDTESATLLAIDLNYVAIPLKVPD